MVEYKNKDLPSPQLELVEQCAGEAVAISDKIKLSLYKKSKNSGYDVDTLEEVYLRGVSEYFDLIETSNVSESYSQYGFNRVNSFIAGGAAADMDKDLQEKKRGLWDNIHAKRERIKRGSGERMRKPGEEGRPTASDFKAASESAHSTSRHFKTGETAEPQSTNPNDADSRFDSTDSAVRIYTKATPGQVVSKKRINTIKKTVRESLELSECESGNCPCKMNEAKYQGREVPLNKPMKGDVKKSKVFVKDPQTGNVKKVNFGDKTLSIKKNNPARKRSYCARSSGQGNLNKKTSANYWSRRAWDC